jgi:hypothetical protein
VTSEVRDYGLEMTFQQPGLANYRFFGGKMCQAENWSMANMELLNAAESDVYI